MAYTKTTWVNGSTALSAEHMNNIETGIEDAHTALADKVDKVEGKGLSTNDYTTEEKNKLAGLSALSTTVIQLQTASGYLEPYDAGSNTISFVQINSGTDTDSGTILTGVGGLAGHAISVTGVTFYNDHSVDVTFRSKTSGSIDYNEYLTLVVIP